MLSYQLVFVFSPNEGAVDITQVCCCVAVAFLGVFFEEIHTRWNYHFVSYEKSWKNDIDLLLISHISYSKIFCGFRGDTGIYGAISVHTLILHCIKYSINPFTDSMYTVLVTKMFSSSFLVYFQHNSFF